VGSHGASDAKSVLQRLAIEATIGDAPVEFQGGARMPIGGVGRNDSCPCGSGKKYKKCCLSRDQAKGPKMVEPHEPEPLEDAPRARCVGHGHDHLRAGVLHVPPSLTQVEAREYIERLDRWSNAARDALDEGRLDQADGFADRLIADYPEQIDGYEVRALVRVEQKRWTEAAEGFEQAAATAMKHRDDYDEEFIDALRRHAEHARAHVQGHGWDPSAPVGDSRVHRHES
jgi:hypothetical protein